MDFPDLDELQWLESNSNLHDQDLEVEEDELYELEPQPEPELKTIDKEIGKHTFRVNSPPRIENISSTTDSTTKKRSRPSTTVDFDVEVDESERIARVRTEQSVRDCFGDSTEIEKCDDVIEDDSKVFSRFASEIEGAFMPITAPFGCGSGERVYAKLEKEMLKDVDKSVPRFRNSAHSSGLTSEPVTLMIQKAEEDILLKALRSSSEVQSTLAPQESSVVTEELWVNKYAPRSFTELLSDEQTNREVLFWLKHWDSKVFGADIRNTEDEVLSALKRHSSIPHHQKHSDASSFRKNRGPTFTKTYMGYSSTVEHKDTRSKVNEAPQNKKLNGSGPPEQKILLLCGPPGLGKTTLAHVAAKHCGYHVSEINASDDRSTTILETKILDAVEMNSIMAGSKPKCLIIDEIDGALGDGKGAVEVLLKMVVSDAKSIAKKEGSVSGELHGKKLSSKGRKAVSMSRPVICICNDLYAPSLRPLRNIAKVHVFAKPTVSRVVSRLKYICNMEGLKTTSVLLTALAELTECDIRACLNTLQFLHKKKESLSLAALSSQVIGRKDIARSVFDVWKELRQIITFGFLGSVGQKLKLQVFQKKILKVSPKCEDNPIKGHEAYESLFSLVSYRGDYELILDGIHENYLQLHYHDPLLQKTVHCLNALGVSDVLQQCVMRSHNMFLYAYFPPIILTIHQMLARAERPTIEWPKSFQRYRMSLMEKREILRSWQSTIGPCFSRHLSIDSAVNDTVSPLLHILSPADLRPVALHLLSDKENQDLTQLVSTMVSYSLTYKNVKPDPLSNISTHDGKMDASQLSLDPPIQSFICYKEYKPGHYELKSAVKQVVVHEVEKQKIVRENASRSKQQSDAVSKISKESLVVQNDRSVYTSKGTAKNMQHKDIFKPSLSSAGLDKTSADAEKTKSTRTVKKASNGSFNFFDRFRKLGNKGTKDGDIPETKLVTAERDERPLIFKFNEGFTNAVKRPVRIREFLS